MESIIVPLVFPKTFKLLYLILLKSLSNAYSDYKFYVINYDPKGLYSERSIAYVKAECRFYNLKLFSYKLIPF